jgi:acyl carrier protein
MNDLMTRVRVLLTTRFGVPGEEFHAGATLSELDLDSLALVEFGLVAEKEFGVQVGEEEITPDHTVDDLVRLLTGKGVAA